MNGSEADPFESLHSLEEQHIQEGLQDGRRNGRVAGLQEGRELGLQKGFEIGVEVGYYSGCVRAWRRLQQLQPDSVPSRAERGIAAMEELLQSYPLTNPQDERLHEALEALRAKFKAVVSMLGRSSDYLPKGDDPQLTF